MFGYFLFKSTYMVISQLLNYRKRTAYYEFQFYKDFAHIDGKLIFFVFVGKIYTGKSE